jgi:hypothetical protein
MSGGVERLGQRGTPQASVRGHRHRDVIEIHHVDGADDRRVGVLGAGDCPTPGRVVGPLEPGRVPGRNQRGQVADGATGHEHPAGRLRHTGQLGQPGQRLVLGIDGACPLHPRPAVEAGGADDEVEQHARLGGSARDERQEPGAVGGDAGLGQLVTEDPQGLLTAQTLGGHGGADGGEEFFRSSRTIQRYGRQTHAIARVGQDGLGQDFGTGVEAVHKGAV